MFTFAFMKEGRVEAENNQRTNPTSIWPENVNRIGMPWIIFLVAFLNNCISNGKKEEINILIQRDI